ncbi:MAG TPA: hypothetical protein VI322_01275, partial [Candidatus Saccharimonadia bacterium]
MLIGPAEEKQGGDVVGFTKPGRGVVAKIKATIFVPKMAPRVDAAVMYKSLHITATIALLLNILASGLPYLLEQYKDAQARIPHPLAATDNQISAPPAADAGLPGSKAQSMPDSVRAELADQFKKEQTGRGRDSRHVQALDEGRSEHNRTYLNADGTK